MKRSILFFAGLVVILGGLAMTIRYLPMRPVSIRVPLGAETPATSSSKRQEPNPEIPSQAGAVLSSVTGTISITRMEKILPATDRMRIESGDKIDLSAHADAIITWPHYGQTHIAGGSTLTVRQAFESTDRLRLMVQLELHGGRIWTHLEQPLYPNSVFDVRMGPILVTVREGSFGVSSNGQKATIQVMQGTTHVLHVTDRPSTGEEHYAGVTQDIIEEVVGKPVDVEAKQQVQVTLGDGSFSALSTMSQEGQSDPFVQSVNVPLSDAQLDTQPILNP